MKTPDPELPPGAELPPHPPPDLLALLADPELADELGDADAGDLAAAADHVRTCDQCSDDVAALRDVRTRLHDMTTVAMPAQVARDLDAALAAAIAADRAAPASPVPSAATNIFELDAGPSKRRGWRPSHGLPTSVAAGVVLLVAIGVGTAIVVSSHGGSSGSKSSSSAVRAAAAPFAAAVPTGSSLVISSHTDYTTADFRQQVGAVLVGRLPNLAPFVSPGPSEAAEASEPAAAASSAAAPASAAASAQSLVPGAAPNVPDTAPEVAPAASGAGPLAAPGALQACVDYLAGQPGTDALLVDHATFDGAPATIITLKDPQDADQLVVYVVDDSVNCESGSVTYTAFLQATGPGISGP
jgi:hypothetical protein